MPSAKSDKSAKSLPGQLGELRALVFAYAKQETLDPIKSLGRYLAWGAAGGLVLGMGFLLLSLAGLRALQQETYPHLTGNLSWVPYAVALVWSAGLAAGLVLQIKAEQRRARHGRDSRSTKGA